MPRRRIAFCITELDPGGAERALVQIVTRLDPLEWEPHVYCLGPEAALAETLRTANVPVDCLGAKTWRDLGVLSKLTQKLKEFQPELLQTFLFHANIFGRLAGRRAHVPVIVSGVRVAERARRWHLWLDWLTKQWSTHWVCVSQAVGEFTRRHVAVRPEQLTVIPNGVDFARFAEASPASLSQFNIPAQARTLLAVGRLHPQKGLMFLLEALAPLLPEWPDLHLLLVGDGPQRDEIDACVRSHNWSGRIHLAGWQENVPGIMRAAEALVLPSLWEGMPNVVLEALAAGLVVIATRAEGVEELVTDGKSGFLYNISSVNELRHAISRWLTAPDRGRSLALEGQDIVKYGFTWDVVTRAYVQLYQHLLEVVDKKTPPGGGAKA